MNNYGHLRVPPLFRSKYKIAILLVSMLNLSAPETDYWKLRKRLLQKEKSSALGGNLTLTAKETEASRIILQLKHQELEKGHRNDSDFLPGQHFLKSRDRIADSQVFKAIREMPKGACLHLHLTASVSADFVLNNILQRKNLHACQQQNGKLQLRFLENNASAYCKPLEVPKKDRFFKSFLKRHFTLEANSSANVEQVWDSFKSVFSTLYYMLSYRPVFEDYIHEALHQLYLDNVFYAEFRATIMPVYELNGTVYSTVEVVGIMRSVIEKFKAEHPGFLGARFIYSPYRNVSSLKSYLSEFKIIKRAFPDFVAGFDLVGYEDKTVPLSNFVDELSSSDINIPLFLHAGETKWYGFTDLNLVDAVLLNVSRIAHGLALHKHPEVLRLIKERDIAVEVTPISNQVLRMVEDPRNHPAVGLIARGYPLVIASDDPGLWDAHGLSFDFYVVFMAMTSQDAGLEVLKQFALNSIRYSAMGGAEKGEAFRVFEKHWEKYIYGFLKDVQ